MLSGPRTSLEAASSPPTPPPPTVPSSPSPRSTDEAGGGTRTCSPPRARECGECSDVRGSEAEGVTAGEREKRDSSGFSMFMLHEESSEANEGLVIALLSAVVVVVVVVAVACSR